MALPTGADEPLRFSMALPSSHITRGASSIRSFTQIRPPRRFIHQPHPNATECSSIFNAKRTGPPRPLTFTMAHVIPKPFLPSPCVSKSFTQIPENRPASSMPHPPDHLQAWFISYHAQPRGLPVGGGQGRIEALPSLNCHPAHGLEKVLLWPAVFPLT